MAEPLPLLLPVPFGDPRRALHDPRFPFLVTGEDHLRVESVNSLTGVTVSINYRYLEPSGRVQANVQTHIPNSDRTVRRTVHALAEGAMLNLTVFATSGAPLIGQTFVRVQIVRGLTGALVVLGTLLQGYITAAQDLGWPGSPIVNSLDGQPVPRILSGTDPAAGVDINETVPTGARWQLHSFRGELATDATVGARRPRLQILDTGTFFLTLAAPATQPASENRNYYWATGLGHESTVDTQVITSSMPDSLILPAGSQIRTNTSLLAGGDNWGAPLLLVREWIEGS